MRRTMLAVLAALLLPVAASAITLGEAQTEADDWILARWDAIRTRIQACVTEGDEGLCHTAWSGAALCTTVAADANLCVNAQDDPGRQVTTDCGTCFNGVGTFALAGISLPNNAPLIASINISRGPNGRSEQVVVQIDYEGAIWERGYGRKDLPDFAWRLVTP